MELKRIRLAALAAVVAVTGTGSVMLAQQLPSSDAAMEPDVALSATQSVEGSPPAAVPVAASVPTGDDDTEDDERTGEGEAAIRRHEDDVNSEALNDDEDDVDDTNDGNNTGDGDGTRGDDGTAGGNNTGDASNTGSGGTTG